jgi:hypothetical protein
MKFWKVGVVLTLALALVLGATLPGLAASNETANSEAPYRLQQRAYRGEVTDIDDSSFTIQKGDGSEVVIGVDDATRFFEVNVPRQPFAILGHGLLQARVEQQEQTETAAQEKLSLRANIQNSILNKFQFFGKPEAAASEKQAVMQQRQEAISEETQLALQGRQRLAEAANGEGQDNLRRLTENIRWMHPFGDEVTFADLELEDQVVVWVVPNDGEPLAKIVLIMTSTAYQRVAGEVTDVDESSLTVMPLSGGDEITFDYDDDTFFNLRLQGTPFLEGQEVVVVYTDEDDSLLARVVTAGGMAVPRVTVAAE